MRETSLYEDVTQLTYGHLPSDVYQTLARILASINFHRRGLDGSDIYYDLVDMADKLYIIGLKLEEREKENGIKE